MGTIYAPQRGRHAAGDEIVRSLVTPETGAIKRVFQSAKDADLFVSAANEMVCPVRFFDN